MAVKMSSEVVGLSRSREVAALFGRSAQRELDAALYRFAEGKIATPSKLNTPVKYGNLRASTHVRKPVNHVVEVGVGGIAGAGNMGETNSKDVGYAVHVHENLEAHHDVGGAKFLENAYRRALATVDTDLATDLQAKIMRKAAA